jgi:hypothetical protein
VYAEASAKATGEVGRRMSDDEHRAKIVHAPELVIS